MSVFSLKDAQQIRLDGVDIHTIKLDGVVIYSAERTGDISIDITDYSVDLNSTISVIYTTTGNLRPEDITVTYDDTKLSRDGNNFTVIGEGYTEIVYNVLGNPHTTIRIATSFEGGLDYNATMDFQTSGYTLPEFVTLNNTYTYGFTYGNYGNGSYGLISGNYHIAGYAWGYLKLDLSELDGSFCVKVTYSCQSESTNYDYGSIGLTTTATMPTSFNMVSKTGNTDGVSMGTSTSTTYTSAGIYYLHFKYTKDGSVDDGYDRLCIHKVEIVYTPNGAVGDMTYPATRLLVPESIINQTNGTFTITPTLIPDNANEKINVSYDSTYLTKSGDTFTCKKMGNTNISYTTTHCTDNVSVNIEPVYISSISVTSTLSSTTNVEPGTSFTLTPTTVPSNHDDELVVEYNSTYLSKSGNNFTILDAARGMGISILYYSRNNPNAVYEYCFTVADIIYATNIYLNGSDYYYNCININSTSSFTITPTLYPSNSTESVSISYNSTYLTKSNDTYSLRTSNISISEGGSKEIIITFSTANCSTTAYIYVENMPSSYSWTTSPDDNGLTIGNTYTATISCQPSSFNAENLLNNMLSNAASSNYIESSYSVSGNSMTFIPKKIGTISLYYSSYSNSISYKANTIFPELDNTLNLDFTTGLMPSYPGELSSGSNTTYSFDLDSDGGGLVSSLSSYASNIYFKIDASNLSEGKSIYITEYYRNKGTTSSSTVRLYGALTTTTTSLSKESSSSNYYGKYTYNFYSGGTPSYPGYDSDGIASFAITSPGIYYLHNNHDRAGSYRSYIKKLKITTDDLNMFSSGDKLVESITLSPSSLTLTPDNVPYSVTSTITPSDATNTNLSWTCSDSNVYIGVGDLSTNASININDTSVAVNSTITVSATDDSGVSASLPVTFTPASSGDSDYYVEYTVDTAQNKALNYTYTSGSNKYYLGLPVLGIYLSKPDINYDKVEITLLDGTITDDLSTKMNNISKVKIWYPENTTTLKFIGYSSSYPNYIKTLSYAKTDNFNNMQNMFSNCYKLTTLDVSNFNTSSVTTMNSMFNNCTSLTSLNLSSFNTSSVTDMNLMFNNCTSLTSLDLSNWNTSNVTSMSSMFISCTSLTSLDLSNFNTSNVTDMYAMFGICTSLTSLNLSSFNTSKVYNIDNMFHSVPSSCIIYIGNNFTKTESQTVFSGTFTHV